MSSSGVSATNSGPLAIRTYNRGSNKTFVLTDYDIPVSSNFVLITSSNGQLVPTNSPTISSIQVSSIRDRDGFTGGNGEILHTNGSTVFWAPIGAGSGYWTENGHIIYNNNPGNVGIGTSTPSTTLDVNGTINANTGLTVSSGNITIRNNAPNGSAQLIVNNTGSISTVSQISMETGNGSYAIYATQSEGAPFGSDLTPSTLQIYSYYPSNTPRNVLTINPDGNIQTYGALETANATIQLDGGITTPNTTIASNGNITCGAGLFFPGTAGAGTFYINQANNIDPTLRLNGPDGLSGYFYDTRYNTPASSYVPYTGAQQDLNMANNNINFNSGSITTIAGNINLSQPGSDYTASINLFNGSVLNASNNSNTTTITLDGQTGNINATGDITGANFPTPSDIRLKNKINTIENPLSTLINLRGVSYYLNKDGSKQIGVIAQEVEKVLPEVVKTDTSDEGYKSVTYGNMVALTIEAIKELSKTVNELNNKVSTLMSK